MASETTTLRVRYIECDMLGVVFNSHFYTWMDLAHTEWMRATLGSLAAMSDAGVDVVVAESSNRYLAPAHFDEEIAVEVALETLGETSMRTTYTFRRGEQELARGWIRHVCVRTEGLAKTPWPEGLRERLVTALPG